MVGLVDCNNFFVSCERVFNPALEGVPVVVLSGNDGCVIARSNEAKAMGIAMGEPFFKIRSLYKDGTLKVCSSNIRLYGDMSKRVMGILRSKTVKTEVYSIDEAFISLEGIPEPADYCRNLVKTIRRSTGIPVSIGIANTRTLAKMASKFAKQYPGYKGCCTIDSDERRTKALKLFPIGNVWGIGRQNKKALNLRGVSTAYDFTLWSEQKVRELLGITGVATWRELQGLPCTHESRNTTEKSVTHSQSFRKAITDYSELSSLVADFAATVAERLRRHGCRAGRIEVYIRTDRFGDLAHFYANTAAARFEVPTNDPREAIKAAAECLTKIFKDGYAYKKAGVTLTEISKGGIQQSFFDTIDREKQERLLQALDAIKRTEGKQSIRVAAQGDGNAARYSEFRSPSYTLCLDDVIKVHLD